LLRDFGILLNPIGETRAENSECQKGRHYTGNSVRQIVANTAYRLNHFVFNHIFINFTMINQSQ